MPTAEPPLRERPDASALADEPAERSAHRSRAQLLRLALALMRLGPLLVLLILVVVIASLTPLFLSGRNLQNVGVQASTIVVLALGQLLVVLTRGIDLSVGSLVSLVTVVGAYAFAAHHAGAVVIALMLGTGAVVGLANGLIIVKGRIPPFIVTLGTLNVIAGLALLVTGGLTKSGMPTVITDLGTHYVAEMPVAVLFTAVLAVVVYGLGSWTRWGRWIYAVGGNPEAARRAGMPVDRILLSVYVLSGLLAAAAAIIVAGRTAAGNPTSGLLLELDAVSAVFIGGTSLYGGRGTVAGVIAGALVISVIRNGLNLLDASPFVQIIVIGCVVIAAVYLDAQRIRLEERFRVLRAGALS